jgi:hypothetical protein
MKMKKAPGVLLIGLVLLVVSCTTEDPVPGSFDFSHVRLAIQYFEAPGESVLSEIATTPAAIHLKHHSDRTGYYSAADTARSITNDLLAELPTQETLTAVGELVQYAEKSPDRQNACMEEAAAYLPDEAQPGHPLYITWGYDIGVAMDDRASLNFAHPHFLENREEVWFYCIHEVHHSGVMQIHPMPKISDIDTVRELYEFTRYATFLEGLAVHSARDARREARALEHDRDYLALEDAEGLEEIISDYWEKLSFLENEFGVPLSDAHWQVVEEMSSGDRLWYVTGAPHIAPVGLGPFCM